MSDLETGEPVWIGHGRSEATLRGWLESLSLEQRSTIKLFAMDLHRGFWNAVDGVPGLEHALVVHDPFHIMKLAGAMLDGSVASLLPRGPGARRRQGTPLAPAPRLGAHGKASARPEDAPRANKTLAAYQIRRSREVLRRLIEAR
ncbi:MAG: transposase [Myxococcales bacterium]|nr:transposase [Myxococcales bacterium]